MGRLKQVRSETVPVLNLENKVSRQLNSLSHPVLRKLAVSADLGRVTLSGKVRSFYERQIAISSVLQVAGVVKLTDNITVTG